MAGDREDVIVALSPAHLRAVAGAAGRRRGREPGRSRRSRPAGRDRAVGLRPRPAVIDEIRRADLFACFLDEDTYMVASEVHDLLVKTHAADREKIETDQGDRLGAPPAEPGALGRGRSAFRLTFAPAAATGTRP